MNIFTRTILSILLLSLFCFGIWSSARAGLSRLFSTYPNPTDVLASMDRAIWLSPSDPEAHHRRGYVLLQMNRTQEALKEFLITASLRPRDYVVWLDLGLTYDQLKDSDNALSAFNKAVQLAPYYGRPRWLLGNLLLRKGDKESAFRELRLAAESDPSLINPLIDLAWGTYKEDVEAIKQAVQPASVSSQLALIHFLIKKGNVKEAVTVFKSANDISVKDRDLLIDELLRAKRFEDAYNVWSTGLDRSKIEGTLIIDGSFEGEIERNNRSFGWQIGGNQSTVQLNLDTSKPYADSRALRVDWKGDHNPSSAVLSQLILVNPKSSYQLEYAARTEKLITGGLPVISIIDAADGSLISQSDPLQPDSKDWAKFKVDFTTKESTQAVIVNLQRLNCTTSPCPIFGYTWLDDLQLKQLKN
jgi:Flp pilus assembly protein TadD